MLGGVLVTTDGISRLGEAKLLETDYTVLVLLRGKRGRLFPTAYWSQEGRKPQIRRDRAPRNQEVEAWGGGDRERGEKEITERSEQEAPGRCREKV